MTLGLAACEPDAPEIHGDVSWAPIESIRSELLAGVPITLVDARPSSDYQQEHIAGALSMPYYDGASRWSELLPFERNIVTYCGCPHAESGYLAQVLSSKGFIAVRGLDEGFFEWRARGYPTVTGPGPGTMPAAWLGDAGAD